ncbi:MAG: hypothetical protein RDV48_01960 [Candidatus Eremiobacteraeota bacterium]|nr:hypothetical protein [Candidatus Eremiobacteraeota bacterium]
MLKDPIVEEIRQLREKLASEHDFDMNKIYNFLMECQAHSGATYQEKRSARHKAARGKAAELH